MKQLRVSRSGCEREAENRLRGAREDLVRLSDLWLNSRNIALRPTGRQQEYHCLVSEKNDVELAMWLYWARNPTSECCVWH